MDGFEKIDLPTTHETADSQDPNSKNSDAEVVITKRRLPSLNFKSKKAIFPLGVLLFVFLVLIFAIILPAVKTYASAKKTYTQVKATVDALKKQNIALASEELDKTRKSLTQTQKDLGGLFILRFIPFANTYYNDADSAIKAGFHSLDAADIVVDSVEPYADVLGLKGQGSFVGGTAQQRIETTVKAMDKITPRIDEVAEKLTLAQKEIDKIDPKDYPSLIASGKVKNAVVAMRKLTDDGVVFINDAKPLIKILPSLLGEPKEKRYLILFQNDKELRPTGGFITAYAIFRLEHGLVHVENSNDIYTLDNTISGKGKAPEPIRKYLPGVPLFNLRDSNLSADFAKSMETFSKMYEDAGGYKKVDGIIAVDTNALVSVMNILGDIKVGGTTYTTKNDERCDCPQVIIELEEDADRPVNYVRGDRKSLIGDLMYEIMNKAFSSSPKLYWARLMQAGFEQIGQKHILFYFYNKDAQSGIVALNAGGKIMPFDGDYFHLNETSFSGAKANLFVDQGVLQEYKVKDDGTIQKTVTVTYKNPHEPSDCNLERGGLCLNAPFRDWFRLYVPKGSKLVDSKGSEVKMTTHEDLGKTVFEGFLTVRPLGSKTLSITYTLPFKLEKGSPLPFMIQKQPGTENDEYIIKSNGKTLNKFHLKTDTTLKLDL